MFETSMKALKEINPFRQNNLPTDLDKLDKDIDKACENLNTFIMGLDAKPPVRNNIMSDVEIVEDEKTTIEISDYFKV